MGIRLSDPKPAYCSACFKGAGESRFVDFDAAFDSGAFTGGTQGAYVTGSDDLHLCEDCVQRACEVLGLKPEIEAAQREHIRKLSLSEDHWRR